MKFVKPFKGIVAGDRYARDFFAGDQCPTSLREAAVAAGAVAGAERSAAGENEILLGSSILAADVQIAAGVTVPLGQLVARAFEDSGLSADAWNALDDDAREEKLASTVELLEVEARVVEGDLVARHRGGGSYSVMSEDKELVEGLKKAEAHDFNSLDAAAKTAFVAERRKG
jgi:hypothetical protein